MGGKRAGSTGKRAKKSQSQQHQQHQRQQSNKGGSTRRRNGGKGSAKVHGKDTLSASDLEDLAKFNLFLEPASKTIFDTERDGNCLFRAVMDQLCVHREKHRARYVEAGITEMTTVDDENDDVQKDEPGVEEESPGDDGNSSAENEGDWIPVIGSYSRSQRTPERNQVRSMDTSDRKKSVLSCRACRWAHSSIEELRARCCDYMEKHEEIFAPFVDEDRKFDVYVSEMREDGTWAGNMELQALSMLLHANFRIYILDARPIEIVNFDPKSLDNAGVRVDPDRTSTMGEILDTQVQDTNPRMLEFPTLLLSYHQQEHYGSVRDFEETDDSRAARLARRKRIEAKRVVIEDDGEDEEEGT
ncbi:hypothetical protein FVE85_0540 [Porphyridium purpureum]|uniref:OTU domain-containing protein n=1 Tax=Porphyridium purpureum TaxID=35688 RepID=A0A5J4YYW6_PORPP|nr:hypothetical protein FVE85_0540 [Porphyridium purpureum]|eukprot:POR8169..scf208_2